MDWADDRSQAQADSGFGNAQEYLDLAISA
jgi:hypothetical protein